jgi:hypothetical protein
MKRGIVVAAAGRRIDADDADVSRFPLEHVERTRRRIRDTLIARGATVVISSAACGADLLALTEAGDLQLRRRAVLPFAPERFVQTSVIDRPGGWALVFDETLRQLRATGDLIILSEPPGDGAYTAASETILDEAERIARENGDRPAALVIWDGRVRPGLDHTKQFRDSAERRGFQIVEVLTSGE